MPRFEILNVKTSKPTAEVAQIVFSGLGIGAYQERESSNYPPEGGYFEGIQGLHKIKVFATDDIERFTHSITVNTPSDCIAPSLLDSLREILNLTTWISSDDNS